LVDPMTEMIERLSDANVAIVEEKLVKSLDKLFTHYAAAFWDNYKTVRLGIHYSKVDCSMGSHRLKMACHFLSLEIIHLLKSQSQLDAHNC
jgi:hypothetical protein